MSAATTVRPTLQPTDRTTSQVVWRSRVVVICVALSAVCFHQSPGLIVPDTKLDLTANPSSFLLRALHLWDPHGAFGQLQDQAYGYLLPMGPFHWVLSAASVPAWVIQRLWWSMILCVAFVGVWRVARALRIGGPWAQLVVALLYAVSPRMLSEVSISSIEVWPMAVAPWVLLPLVITSPRTWPWRVSRSALAFALIGGVNAVATGAALILPTVWFLTRRRDRRTVMAGAGWLGLVTAVSLWWFLPLLQLGRYSPPFLSWIEDAAVTTSTASVFEAFRGTSAWVGFLGGPAGPSWPAGWQFVTTPLLIVGTAAVSTAGLVGLSLRSTPHRRFLAIGAAAGLLMLTFGHSGAAGSPLAGPLQTLLDGPLAALRNTHKFELVLLLPLMLAAAQGLTLAGARLRALRAPGFLAPVLLTSLVILVTAPAIVGGMARPEGYVAIPAHWYQAAAWLDHQTAPGTVLVVPASSFADFTWGSTKDEPLQALMRRPFAVRDAVPLGSAGSARLLDEIERQLGDGSGGSGLHDLLVRAGVRYVVVRDDLRMDAQGDPLIAVHQSLAESGIFRVAAFGPPAGSPVESPTLTIDERTFVPYPSVEIFDVGATQDVSVVPRSRLVTASAGPEDVGGLSALYGVDGASVLGSDVAGHGSLLATAPHVLTDGQRRREVFFGRATQNTSQVLAAEDPGRQRRRALDYVSDASSGVTVLQWAGVSSVEASSSASDASAGLRLGTAYSPAAAVDGDPGTRWVSGNFGQAIGEWLEVTFSKPVDLRRIGLGLSARSPIGAAPHSVAVTTDRGTRSASVDSSAGLQSLPTAAGFTRRVRVTLTSVSAGPVNGFSIADLSIPGVTPVASLSLPSSSAPAYARVDAILLRDQLPGRSACLHVGDHPLCRVSVALPGEESSGMSRLFRLPAQRTYLFSGEVLPRDGVAVERLLARPNNITASASSRAVGAAEGRPDAAVDRDLATAWIASPLDRSPWLRLSWPRARRVSGFQLLADPYLAGSRPSRVTVRLDSGEVQVSAVGDQGYVRFPARFTRTLDISFTGVAPVTNVDSATGLRQALPVGVGEVRVLGADDLRGAVSQTGTAGAPCGFGPTLMVDGSPILTRVEGTVRDILHRQPLRWLACGSGGEGVAADGSVNLAAGAHRVSAGANGEFEPLQMSLTTPIQADLTPAPPVAVSLFRADPGTMRFTVGQRSQESVLTVAQNFSAGWTARNGQGVPLVPIRLDGWKQGWVLPAGSATVVTARFTPDGWYRGGLLVGLFALVCAAALVPLSRRRLRVRPGREAPGEAKLPAAVVILGGAVALALMSGWAGAAVGVAAGLLLLSQSGVLPGFRRTRFARIPGLIPGLVLAAGLCAGVLAAMQPWPQGSSGLHSVAVQVLTLLAFTVACAAAFRGEPSPAVTSGPSGTSGDGETSKRRSRRPRRMMGRSTRR